MPTHQSAKIRKKINLSSGLFISILTLLALATPALASDIAYLAYTDSFWQIWTMDDKGGDKKQVTASAYDKAHLSWYADGRHILTAKNDGNVFKIDVETGKETPLKIDIPGSMRGLIDPVISPDGAYIALSLNASDAADANNIWIVDIDGTNPKKITKTSGMQHSPAWGPQGDWVYYLTGVTSKEDHNIWRVSLTKGFIQQITYGALYNLDIAVSSQGVLAFSSNRKENYEIWLKDGVNKPVRLTNDSGLDARPSWSPNGKHLAFESSRSGPLNIWKINMKTKELKQLTTNPMGARFPVWNPRKQEEAK